MNLWGLPPQALIREFAANTAMALAVVRRSRLKGMRTRAPSADFEARKIGAQFEFLRDSAGDIEGKVVVEIGPGDALGLAPLFIAAGAARYVAVDRFLGDVWGIGANRIYDEIERLRGPFPTAWRDQVTLVRHSIEKTLVGVPSADIIVSFDVIEHLLDLPQAVRNMSSLLTRDGRMIHRIDYGPHGVWLSTQDPLSFLSVPDWLWSAIGSNRGYPNRVRHGQFVQLLEASGLHIAERVTRRQEMDVMDAEVACAFKGAPQLGKPFVQEFA
ncbi:MAG TPA: class I SAM-dependent methyltransferase [Steroidobacteraceae bacterium]|nr:class I SAM-dependent methyltransferase [Steroidobacteraceae bacterium]